MNTANHTARLASDLASYWTEPVLESLKEAGNWRPSVEGEIEAWHILTTALQTALPTEPVFGLPSFTTVKRYVIHRASAELAEKYDLRSERLQQPKPDRRVSGAELRLFAELTGQSGDAGEFRSARQTDVMPRLQLAAAGV